MKQTLQAPSDTSKGILPMRPTLRQLSQAVEALDIKVETFLAGVHNKDDIDGKPSGFDDSFRPLIRCFVAAMLIDAPQENSRNLYSLVLWNASQGRVPGEFLNCPEFLEQRDFLENKIANCTLHDLLDRVRLLDISNPWSELHKHVESSLNKEQRSVLNFYYQTRG